MGFVLTSMMLTYNLDLYYDSLWAFTLKANLMAFWYTLIFIYPIFIYKSR
jgi:hypothetical protein